MVLSIEIKRPLFIVGPPGSSKSLSKSIVQNSMVGALAPSGLFRRFKAVQLRVLQCSPHTTTLDLEEHFQATRGAGDEAVVVLEEAGLAELSPDMPLKVSSGGRAGGRAD